MNENIINKQRDEFINNNITKLQYMENMYDRVHKYLFEYASYIKNSNVSEISISNNGNVYFTLMSNGKKIKMLCDPSDKTSIPLTFFGHNAYESKETKFILSLIKDNSIVLDIGANNGWYTLNVLKNKINVKVFSFEPIPALYENLIQNLKLNKFPINNAYNIGISNINEKIEFFFDPTSHGASSIKNNRKNLKSQKIKCNVESIDNIVLNLDINKIDFVKIDVEGNELNVIKGGIKTLKKFYPIIFIELLRKWSSNFGYHPNDVIKILLDIGYYCYEFNVNKLKRIETITSETEITNYFFIHSTNKTLGDKYGINK